MYAMWSGTHEAVTEFTHCCLWKWPRRKTSQVIRRCHPCAKKSASQAILSRMQPILDTSRRTPHGASPLRASNVCLVVEKPDVFRPFIPQSRGSMFIRPQPSRSRSTPSRPVPSHPPPLLLVVSACEWRYYLTPYLSFFFCQ